MVPILFHSFIRCSVIFCFPFWDHLPLPTVLFLFFDQFPQMVMAFNALSNHGHALSYSGGGLLVVYGYVHYTSTAECDQLGPVLGAFRSNVSEVFSFMELVLRVCQPIMLLRPWCCQPLTSNSGPGAKF